MKDIIIQELIKLEPVFVEAGKLALRMQEKTEAYNKSETGEAEVDIVTKLDLDVQKIILEAMAKTPLINCHLLAEENTPQVKAFAKSGNMYLTVDPINGTSLYAEKKKYWNLIVTLRDDKEFFYTYTYYPAADWAARIVGKKYENLGKPPKVKLFLDASRTIVYSYGSTDVIEPRLYKKLIDQGYNFKLRKTVTDESGSTTLLMTGQAAGYFNIDPNVYDSLVAMHYAQAMKYKIYSFGTGPNGELDLAEMKDEGQGLRHPGYYIVLREKNGIN